IPRRHPPPNRLCSRRRGSTARAWGGRPRTPFLRSPVPAWGHMHRRSEAGSVDATDSSACREAALKLLERTRRTRSDLERRLKEKGFAPGTVADVVGRLVEVNLADDAEYARAW